MLEKDVVSLVFKAKISHSQISVFSCGPKSCAQLADKHLSLWKYRGAGNGLEVLVTHA